MAVPAPCRKSNLIDIIQVPQPSFTADRPSGCTLPHTVNFTNTTNNASAYDFLWDFGDSQTSTDQDPVHTYAAFGNYPVSLTVTDPVTGCSLSTTVNDFIALGDIVNFDHVIAFSGDCSNTQVSFTNLTQGDISTLVWDFDDGNTSNDPNPVHTYTTSGCYFPSLTISTTDGCNSSETVTECIEVLGPVTMDYTSNGNLNSCTLGNGSQISFTGQSSPSPVEWFWDFGGQDTSDQQNPTVTFDQYGIYPITLMTTYSNGCVRTLTKDTVVIQALNPTFTSDTTEGCIDLFIQFTNTTMANDPISSYSWDFGNGQISIDENPTAVYTDTGSYDVTLIVESISGCRDTLTIPEYINAGTKPSLDFQSDYQQGCIDTVITFDSNSSGNIDEWEWLFGDGGSSNEEDPMYQYQDTGVFDVTLVGWFNGCSDTLVIEDYIQISPPIASILFTLDCAQPYTVAFEDNSVGPDSWLWDFGDGNTSTDQNPVHTYSQTGTYTVTLDVGNATTGCNDQATATITIDEVDAIFDIGPKELCVGDTASVMINYQTGVNYTYIFPPEVGMITDQSVDPDPQFYFDTPGVYGGFKLIVTNVNGCIDSFDLADSIYVWATTADFSVDAQYGCPPHTANFTSLSSSTTGTITSYLWDFGDGNTSTDENPTHTFSNGSHDVSLTVTNEKGCSNTLVRPNYIGVTFPNAEFEFSLISCDAFEIAFANNSSGYGLSYDWDFGDGEITSDYEPVHIYTNPGAYEVCLTVTTDPTCFDVFCDTVKVSGLQAAFSGDNVYKSCPSPPLVTTFTDESQNAVGWEWDFGDGTGTSNLQNPSHSYSQAGQFTVCLTITDTLGCQDQFCRPDYITVDGPSGSFTSSPAEGCQPLEVTFDASATNAIIYNWDFGDGTGTINVSSQPTNQTTHVYTQGGLYEPVLILEDASGCKVPTVGSTILVESLAIDFSTDPAEQCDSDNGIVNFTPDITSFGDITSYAWEFPGSDTPVSNQENPSVTYDNAGSYDVRLTVTTIHCTETILKNDFIIIHPNPVADFNISPATGCEPLEVTLSDQSTIAFDDVVDWQWDLGDGSIDSGSVVQHTYATNGSLVISLTATSDFGCSATATDTLVVEDTPEVGAIGGPIICIGESLQLTTNLLDGNNVTYQWTPSDSLSCTDCPSPIASPDVNTIYTVSVTNPNGCSHSDTVLVNVSPFSVPVVTITDEVTICRGESVTLQVNADASVTNYVWLNSRPGLSCYTGCNTPVATPTETTTYVVDVIGQGGCMTTDSVTVNVLEEYENILGEDRTICLGDNYQLETLFGTNPVWSPALGLSCTNCPNPVTTPLDTITYTVTVLNTLNCPISDTITINVKYPDEVDAGADSTICVGEEIQLEGLYDSGAVSWWIDNDLFAENVDNPTVQPQTTTTYRMVVTDDLCVIEDDVTVNVTQLEAINVADQQICEGETVVLETTGNAQRFSWSPPTGLSATGVRSPIASPVSTTTYQVDAYVGRCLVGSATSRVTVIPKPLIGIPDHLEFVLGNTISLNAKVLGAGRFSYRWFPTDHLSCVDCHNPIASPDSSKLYSVEVTDEFGCIDTASVQLHMLPVCYDESIVVPTAFTPNNDGENDIFRIRGNAEITIFRIFNRWGEIVFETNSASQGWNGTFNGKPLNRDVFVYYIEGICPLDGSPVIRTGDVTLIR